MLDPWTMGDPLCEGDPLLEDRDDPLGEADPLLAARASDRPPEPAPEPA